MSRLKRMTGRVVAMAAALVLGGLAGCQPSAILPSLVSPGRATVRNGVRVQVAIQRFLPKTLRTQAVIADIVRYKVILCKADGTLFWGQDIRPGDLNDTTLVAAIFDTVPDGSYTVTVDALNAAHVSIMTGGVPVRSLNQVTVTSPNVSYSDYPTGVRTDSLLVQIGLNSGVSAPAGQVLVNMAAGGTLYATLTEPGTQRTLASFNSLVSPFKFTSVADGTYAAWGFFVNGTLATLPGPSAGTVTVSGSGSTVSGSLTLTPTAATVSTVAGGGLGDVATPATVDIADAAILTDSADNLFLLDRDRRQVRAFSPTGATLFGVSLPVNQVGRLVGGGYANVDGTPAQQRSLTNLTCQTMDAAGNLFIAESETHRVLVVPRATGMLFGRNLTANATYVLAGTGTAANGGDDEVPWNSGLVAIRSLACDADGNLYILGQNQLQMIARVPGTYFGKSMNADRIYTLIGGGWSLPNSEGLALGAYTLGGTETAIAVDAQRNLYMASIHYGTVMIPSAATTLWNGVNKAANTCWRLSTEPAVGLCLDPTGNLVYATGSNYVKMIARVTQTCFNQFMTANQVYTLSGNGNNSPEGSDGDPGSTVGLTARDLHADRLGNILVRDATYNRLRMIASQAATIYGRTVAAGRVYNLVGSGTTPIRRDGVSAAQAVFSSNRGNEALWMTPQGDFVVAHDSLISILPAATVSAYGQTLTAGTIQHLVGLGALETDGAAGSDTRIRNPLHMRTDLHGNIVFLDMTRVRILPRQSGIHYGRAMVAGNVYTLTGITSSYSNTGDGGPATGATVWPRRLAFDQAGNLFIGSQDRVRMLPYLDGTSYGAARVAGTIYTVVGGGGQPVADDQPRLDGSFADIVSVEVYDDYFLVGCKGDAKLYLVTSGAKRLYGALRQANRTYHIAGDGSSTANANLGSLGLNAGIESPQDSTCLDAAGNLYIAYGNLGIVTMVAPDTRIYRVAGVQAVSPVGDGVGPEAVGLQPRSITMAPNGALYVLSHGLIRKIAGP